MPYKEYSREKLHLSTGDIAEILNENVSLVRFWSDKFSSFIKPSRNAKGNRVFTQADLKTFKTIYHLVKEKGMTLEGAAYHLKYNKNVSDHKAEVVERLQEIKKSLQEIYDGL